MIRLYAIFVALFIAFFMTMIFGQAPQPFNFIDQDTTGTTWAIPTGSICPNFTLYDTNYNAHNLYAMLSNGPVIIETISITCKEYRNKLADMDQLKADFPNVQHLMVYVTEANPDSAQPFDNGHWSYWPMFLPGPGTDVSLANILDSVLYDEPTTYHDRVILAEETEQRFPHQPGSVQVLDNRFNWFWKNIIRSPSGAILVTEGGYVCASHGWLHVPTMRANIVDCLITDRPKPIRIPHDRQLIYFPELKGWKARR